MDMHQLIQNSWKSSTLVLDFSFNTWKNFNLHTLFILIYCFRSIHMEWTYFQIYAFLFNLSPKSSPCPLWQVLSYKLKFDPLFNLKHLIDMHALYGKCPSIISYYTKYLDVLTHWTYFILCPIPTQMFTFFPNIK
jgi:hypothetical protein